MRRRPQLEQFEWRSMPLARLALVVTALVVAVLCGPFLLPIVVYDVTGSVNAGLWALLAMLFAPWLIVGARPALRWVPWGHKRRLAPAPSPLALPSAGELRRGRARACGMTVQAPLGGGPCLAALLRARSSSGTYAWQIQSSDFEVLLDEGARVRVVGSIALDGNARPLPAGEVAGALQALGLPADVAVPGTLELVLLRDGDAVELRGPVAREQVASGYREAAEVDVMRGAPGRPVAVSLSSTLDRVRPHSDFRRTK